MTGEMHGDEVEFMSTKETSTTMKKLIFICVRHGSILLPSGNPSFVNDRVRSIFTRTHLDTSFEFGGVNIRTLCVEKRLLMQMGSKAFCLPLLICT